MQVTVIRDKKTDKSTTGKLSVDGIFVCYTLEDIERTGEKVYGETAIPTGTYRVVLDFSARFNRILPHILDVPGFEGIRIHPGNTAADTDGCILVGDTRDTDLVGQSRVAFDRLFRKLQAATDQIQITIQDDYAKL